jgi:hypothetical protein
VGIVDALDWMWHATPLGVEHAGFHLVQGYYGPDRGGYERQQKRVSVAPIVDPRWGRRANVVPTRAVILFSGMSVPEPVPVADYAHWFLTTAVPVLEQHVDEIIILGSSGLTRALPPELAAKPFVRVIAGLLNRPDYVAMVKSAAHVLAVPGVATIYELYKAGIDAFYQPGFSVSMLMQLADLCQSGQRWHARWPWDEQFNARAEGLSENEALSILARRIAGSLSASHAEFVRSNIEAYLQRTPGPLPDLSRLFRLPDPCTSFCKSLEALI